MTLLQFVTMDSIAPVYTPLALEQPLLLLLGCSLHHDFRVWGLGKFLPRKGSVNWRRYLGS